MERARFRGLEWALAAVLVAAGSWLVITGRVDLEFGQIQLQVSDRVDDAAAWLAEAPAAVLPTVILPPTATSTPTASATPRPTTTRLARKTPIPTATATATPTLEPTVAAGFYVVRSGDTLAAISRRFGVSVEDMAAVNGIVNPEALQVDQELIIPAPSVLVQDEEPSPPATNTPLAVVAAVADTSVPDAQPSESPEPPAPGGAAVAAAGDGAQDASDETLLSYAVQAGDTLEAIARKYQISVESLMDSNSIDRPESLQVDQVLVIPIQQSGNLSTPDTSTDPSASAGTGAGQVEDGIYVAPRPLAPIGGVRLLRSEHESVKLSWESNGLPEGVEFVVHLGYDAPTGSTVWLIDSPQNVPLRTGSYTVAGSVLASAEGPTTAQIYRWYVQIERVVRGSDGSVQSSDTLSPPSETASFIWE